MAKCAPIEYVAVSPPVARRHRQIIRLAEEMKTLGGKIIMADSSLGPPRFTKQLIRVRLRNLRGRRELETRQLDNCWPGMAIVASVYRGASGRIAAIIVRNTPGGNPYVTKCTPSSRIMGETSAHLGVSGIES